MNHIARKFAGILALVLIANVILGIIVDVEIDKRTVKEVREITQISVRDSTKTFQNADFTKFLAPDGKLNNDNYTRYKAYLDTVQRASSDSSYKELESLTGFLKQDAEAKISSGDISSVYTPLQFDLTYLDEASVKAIFKDDIERMFKYNYDPSFNKMRTIDTTAVLDSVEVKLDGPHIVDFSKDTSKLTYAQIFGTDNRSKSIADLQHSASTIDSSKYGTLWGDNFNQVVSYIVTCTVNWKYVTQSPIFKQGAALMGNSDYVYKPTGAIMIPQDPMVITMQYVLTN